MTITETVPGYYEHQLQYEGYPIQGMMTLLPQIFVDIAGNYDEVRQYYRFYYPLRDQFERERTPWAIAGEAAIAIALNHALAFMNPEDKNLTPQDIVEKLFIGDENELKMRYASGTPFSPISNIVGHQTAMSLRDRFAEQTILRHFNSDFYINGYKPEFNSSNIEYAFACFQSDHYYQAEQGLIPNVERIAHLLAELKLPEKFVYQLLPGLHIPAEATTAFLQILSSDQHWRIHHYFTHLLVDGQPGIPPANDIWDLQ